MLVSRNQARQATRRAVLEAASQLFGERGFVETTIRDIAERADVSVGSVMAAGDKNALLVQLFDSLIEKHHEMNSAVTIDKKTNCSCGALRVVEPFVELFAENRDLARHYASILVAGRHRSAVFTDLADRLAGEFEQVIKESGCSSQLAARARAEALHAAYVGSLFMWSSTPDSSVDELNARLRRIFKAICPSGETDS